jgi:hypothetical protein
MKFLFITLFLISALNNKVWANTSVEKSQTQMIPEKLNKNSELKTDPVVKSDKEIVNSNLPINNSAAMDTLLGFQAWKEMQVSKARANLNLFKTPKSENIQESNPLSVKNVENSAEKAEIDNIQSKQAEKLRQLEFNLEIALGLTIHDYFSLYLKDKSKEEMAIVIPQLTPDELSSLLIAYRKTLYGLPIVEKPNEKTLNQNL